VAFFILYLTAIANLLKNQVSKMTIKSIFSLSFMLCVLFLLTACDNQSPALAEKKELLIYCGITMEKPIRELAEVFEKKENCTIKIMIGGSGTLYRTIMVNKTGDLYLPGSEAYIKKALADGIVTEARRVGYNRAALIVAKSNPLGISTKLENLADKKFRIVLGSPDSGSIGKETKKILTNAGFYEKALDNSLYLTSDSKGLRQAITEGVADLTLNWGATTFWRENKENMEALRLDDSVAVPHRLMVSLLKYTQEPELAERLFNFICSETGRETFKRYGFGEK
jgi:molybdate transport system substrate-binding protein